MTRKRWLIIAATLVASIILPIAWYLGSPLLFDRAVDEAFPVAQPASLSQADSAGMPADEMAAAMDEQVKAISMEQSAMVMKQPVEAQRAPTATKAPRRKPTPTRVPTRKPAPTATSVPRKPSPTPVRPTAVPSQPVVLKSGRFHPVGAKVAGTATIYRLADGRRILRLENFSVTNGPDLYVYLSAALDANDDKTILDNPYVNLGKLKGNKGNQNYELPANVDLGRFHSVSIWCKQFSHNFAMAPLR